MAELARLGRVSRARVTQIMDLLLLAPEIQEEVLVASAVDPCSSDWPGAQELVAPARTWLLSGSG